MNQKGFLKDFVASIVVFLVALPLCIGIAIASGVPEEKGIITGIVGGLVVGFIAGSPLQVSGPAAGLAIIILELVKNPEIGLVGLGAIVFAAGLLQLIFSFLKFGQFFRAISPAVIVGMLSGIGVLIFASQFHVMIDDPVKDSGLENLKSIPEAFIKVIYPPGLDQHHLAAYAGIITILSLVFWNRFRPQKLKFVPGTLIGVICAIVFAQIFKPDINYIALPKALITESSLLSWGSLKVLLTSKGILLTFTVAIVASAESLLCATAVDKLHDGERTNYDKELFAQGIGNTICGFLGALPMTGVIVRSSANINSGGKTRYSAILHGGWLLLFVVIFPGIINLVPKASLAAILVYIGFKLINIAFIKELRTYGKMEVFIYLATIISIVLTDLLTGIMIGFGLALLKIVYTMTHLEIIVEKTEDKIYDMRFKGTATFLKIPDLVGKLESLPWDSHIKVHLDGLSYIDHACIDVLKAHSTQLEKRGGKLNLCWDSIEKKSNQKPSEIK